VSETSVSSWSPTVKRATWPGFCWTDGAPDALWLLLLCAACSLEPTVAAPEMPSKMSVPLEMSISPPEIAIT
jgi:hypothetical protein